MWNVFPRRRLYRARAALYVWIGRIIRRATITHARIFCVSLLLFFTLLGLNIRLAAHVTLTSPDVNIFICAIHNATHPMCCWRGERIASAVSSLDCCAGNITIIKWKIRALRRHNAILCCRFLLNCSARGKGCMLARNWKRAEIAEREGDAQHLKCYHYASSVEIFTNYFSNIFHDTQLIFT